MALDGAEQGEPEEQGAAEEEDQEVCGCGRWWERGGGERGLTAPA